MRRGVNTRGSVPFRGVFARSRAARTVSALAFSAWLGCGGAATTIPTQTLPSSDAAPDGDATYALEGRLLDAAPRMRCEPAVFASGDVELARAVDRWLSRGELGYGVEVGTLAPIEAFRVGPESVRLERRRSLAGTRARIGREGEDAMHAYAETGTVPEDSALGQIAYVVRADEQRLVGSFCRTDFGIRTACRYAAFGDDAAEPAFGPSLTPLADVVVLPMIRGGRDLSIVVGHELVDDATRPPLVLDYVDVAARTVERVITSFEARTVFVGARVEGEALTLFGMDDETWREAERDGRAHATREPTLGATRACHASETPRALARVRIPLGLYLGGEALETNTITPPFELVYAEDAEGPCDARLELANREGGNGSLDGSLGGVLRALPGSDDAFEGVHIGRAHV